MRVKVFTHTDLDGLGCAFLLKTEYGSVDISYLDYKNINTDILKFINKGEVNNFDKIYITDISVSEEVAEIIDKKYSDLFILIDHHINDSTSHLYKYNWVTLKGNKDINDNELCSGTWLVYQHISKNWMIKSDFVKDIVTSIDRYDTWLWKTKYNNFRRSKDLNDIFHLIGRDKFLDDLLFQFDSNNDKYIPSEVNLALLQLNEEKYQRMLENCNKYMQRINYKDYIIGVVYTTEFVSELGNDLAKKYVDLDFIALVNLNSGYVSFRGVKDYIHLGNFAKELGESLNSSGGGHSASSSMTLPFLFRNNILLNIFNGGKFI